MAAVGRGDRNVMNHSQIEERAAAWLAQRESGRWTNEDETELAGWLAEATHHRVAFLRLEAVNEETYRLRALGAGMESPARLPSRARLIGKWAAAACLALVFAAGWAVWTGYFGMSGEHYGTQIGGVQSVSLRDGSAVTLNTATAIRVKLGSSERHIELQEGEAYFSVAKDSARPFIVKAGNQSVVAVGTQFSVRREGSEVRIVVTEGTVSLPAEGGIRVSAGSVIRVRGANALVQHESDEGLRALLSWRQGFLTFRDTTLAEAVNEFNRYNVRHIRIADPGVAQIKISGTFRPTHYDAFVRLLDEGYSIRAEERGPDLVLTQN